MLGIGCAAVLCGAALAQDGGRRVERTETRETTTVQSGRLAWLRGENERPILRYVTGEVPEGERAPSVEGTCFTHPLHTPSGAVVTDVGPADHPHHRGVFSAWVEVEGERTGDWWGWGAKAPKDGRRISNRALSTRAGRGRASLRAENDWLAEDRPVLRETVAITARTVGVSNVIDYELRYAAPTKKPVVLAQNPFGGFCYRAKPRGKQLLTGPNGPATYRDSVFDKAETNWPSAGWYDLSYEMPDGTVNGVAVMSHPDNPASTWHVVRGIHMLNPCIVAAGPVTIQPGKPLVLRYRLVAHDGAAAAADLPALYREFSKG